MRQSQSRVLVVDQYSSRVQVLETDNLNLKIAPFSRNGRILSSCNGLTILHPDDWVPHVVNLVTKDSVAFPLCSSLCPYTHTGCGIALAFDPSTNEYKVMHLYDDRFGLEIFNLGWSKEKWKRIPGPFNEPLERPFNPQTFRWTNVVSVNGQFLYWNVESNRYIVGMNVSDEKWRRINLPDGGEHRYDLLEMGGKLALFYPVSDTQIDVWILEEFEEQKWIKRHSIMADSISYTMDSSRRCTHPPNFTKLFALTALEDGQVIMFKHKISKHAYYLYDMKRGKLKRSNVRKIRKGSRFVHYRKRSLVCWRNGIEKELPADNSRGCSALPEYSVVCPFC